MSVAGENGEKNLLMVIGLCRAAGKAVIGVPMICELLQKRAKKRNCAESAEAEPELIVIEASDTSVNTHKRICDKCAYYKVKHVQISSTCLSLGGAVGKGAVAAVAIDDKSFCRAVLKKLEEMRAETTSQ